MSVGDPDTTAPPDVVGGELRRQREMRGISIREISEATKISVRFLESIEAEDFGNLPAPVFTRGFIREYAKQIGLDPDDIVHRYMEFVAREQNREDAERVEMDRRISGGHRIGSRWPIVTLAILAFASIGIVIGIYSGIGEGVPRPTPVPPMPVPSPVERVSVGGEPAGSEEAVEAASPEVDAATLGKMRLQIVVDDDCYLTLSIDGERVISGEVLHPGETRQFEATSEILFETIGNAGGIRVLLDGVEVPAFGRRGDVIKNRVLDRTSKIR